MRFFVVILSFSLLFLANCRVKGNYEKEVAVLDSIKIVLQVKLNELKKAEVNVQNNSYSKYSAYVSFLNNNLKDTVDKNQANALRSFISSGKIIQSFIKEQPALIKETETSIAQIQKLSADLKQNSIQPNAVQKFFNTEKDHAGKLIGVIEANLKSLTIGIINFRNSVPKTEDLIRQINNGQLPSIVIDSIPV